MAYQSRSVYELGDDARQQGHHLIRVPTIVVPIVLHAPRPLPPTATFDADLVTPDGAAYVLTYRLEQRPEAWVGVLESCRREASPYG
jgi:hypothetical protein